MIGKLKPRPIRRGPLADIRRAGLIILRASFGIWSSSMNRPVRISDIWESPNYERW